MKGEGRGMGKAAFVSLAVLGILSVMLIGAGVPIASVYCTIKYGLNIVAATIISFFAVLCAGVLGFFLFAFVFEDHASDILREELSPRDREKLNLLRSHLRATLDELDEIKVLLGDIRDVLKEAGG